MFRGQIGVHIGVAAMLLVGTLGCRSESEKKRSEPSAASASASARLPAPPRRNWPQPSGPRLAILAGQGVGPIRIGANIATIERLMAAPCDIKTPAVCRYFTRAVEFELDKGVTKQIHVHRAGRPAGQDGAGKPAEYGFFNGAIPPDLMLGMIPAALQEHLGPPARVERSGAPGEALNVEVHHYNGVVLEYDRIANGNLILGGVLIFRQSAPDAGPAAPGAKQPAGSAGPAVSGSAAPTPAVRIH